MAFYHTIWHSGYQNEGSWVAKALSRAFAILDSGLLTRFRVAFPHSVFTDSD